MMHYYKVTLRVQNDVGVLARITVLLRKFQVNIRSLHIEPIDTEENFSEIKMEMESKKAEMETVIKKVGRLIPVISIDYEKK